MARKNVKTTTKTKAVAKKATKTKAVVKTKAVAKKATKTKAEVKPTETVSKKAQVIELLRKGTTATEIMEATGWLRHTTRAYVSVLSRSGFPCTTTLVNNERFYKLNA